MAVSQTDVEGLYLAYFGRPADPNGLAFYTSNPDVTLTGVEESFSTSAESQALYGAFSTAQINAIYRNLFNRDAEPAGLIYWYDLVNTGVVSAAGAAFAILKGAQNDDLLTINNKLQVCQAFTGQLDTQPEIAGYAGDTAAQRARLFIQSVDASTASRDAALADVGTQAAYSTGLAAPTFAATKDASNAVSFTHAGTIITVSQANGIWTFTTFGGSAGSATVAGTIASVVLPSGTTIRISSTLAGAIAFTGGSAIVLASPSGEDLTATLTGSGVTSIELSTGHDYTLTKAQADIAQIGALGTAGTVTDSGKVTVSDSISVVGGGEATTLKAHGVDSVIAELAPATDISATSLAGIDAIRLASGALNAMTAAQATMITTSAGTQVVTLTDAATKLVLSSEIETFKLAGGVANSVTMGAVDQVVKGTSGDDTVTAIDGVKSTNDLGSGDNVVVVTAGVDISAGKFSATGGTLGYDVDAATTAKMTVAQVAEITSADGTQDITLADIASGITLDKTIETFTLGAFANVVTMGAKAQSIIGGSKADTVTVIDGVTSTSDLMAGANVVLVGDGFDISAGAFNATGGTVSFTLDGVATAKMSAAEAANIGSATGTQDITLGTAATALKLAAGVETFTLGAFTNSVTIGAAAQDVTGSTGADTIDTGGLAVTGTLNGGGGTSDKLTVSDATGAATVSNIEILNVSGDADISALNGGSAVGTTTLTMGASVDLTMTIAQNQGLKSSATVSGAGQSVTLTAAGTANMIAGVETYNLAAGASHLTTGSAGQTVNGNALADADLLTLSGTVAVTVTLTDGDLDASGYTGAVTVKATTGSNVITTGSGADVVTAGSGSNTIALGGGADTLVLNSLSGVDTVSDFSASSDKIQLSKAVYAALGSVGALGASAFETGAGLTAAATPAGRIVYDSSTGDLYYDSDGSGLAAAVLIGTFTNTPTLAASHFTIVS